jgi:hypothetical protein
MLNAVAFNCQNPWTSFKRIQADPNVRPKKGKIRKNEKKWMKNENKWMKNR